MENVINQKNIQASIKFEVMISTIPYATKPTPEDCSRIKFCCMGFRSIHDLACCIGQGYSISPGLFDYISGGEYTDSHMRRGIVDMNNLPNRWRLLSHWVGGYCVFLDIDKTTIPPQEFTNNLTYKPNIVYYSFSGARYDEARGVTLHSYRLGYVFNRFLEKDLWFGALTFLADKAEQDNSGRYIDRRAMKGTQLMHGTSGLGQILYCDEDYYDFDSLGCPSLEYAIRERLDVPAMIIYDMNSKGLDGQEFINYVNSPYCYAKTTTKAGKVDGICRRYGKYFDFISRTENFGPWIPVFWGDKTIEYQNVDPNLYIEITPPGRDSYDLEVDGKIKVNGGRKRYLRKCAYLMRMIKPDITMQEMLYSLVIYRDFHCHLGKGVDRVTSIDLYHIIELVYLKDRQGLEKMTSGWIERCRQAKKNKRIIIRKTYIPRLFDFTRQYDIDEYIRISKTREGCRVLSKEEIRQIAPKLKSLVYGAYRQLGEYYTNHPLTTPISVVAAETGLGDKTVRRYLADYYGPIQADRKERTDYSRRGKITATQFAFLYDPNCDDEENMQRMGLSRNTYYKYKRQWKNGNR